MSESHPERAELAAFRDGELPGDRRAEVSDHLVHCSRCREEIRSLDQLSEAIAELPKRARVPDEAWTEIEASIHSSVGADDRDEVGWTSWAAAAATAAAAVAAFWLYGGTGGPGTTSDFGGTSASNTGPDAPPIQTLDRAMTDIREALRRRPDDPYLRRYLARTRRLRAKLEHEIRFGRSATPAETAHPEQEARR